MVKELIFKKTHSREMSLGYGKAFRAFEEVKEGVVRTECWNSVERADGRDTHQFRISDFIVSAMDSHQRI